MEAEKEVTVEMLPVSQATAELSLSSFFGYMAVNSQIINAGLLVGGAASVVSLTSAL